MAGAFPTSREIAQPMIDELKEALLLDDHGIHLERRNEANDIIIWYEVSILSHEELRRVVQIADARRAMLAVLPDDKSRMKVELCISLKSNRAG